MSTCGLQALVGATTSEVVHTFDLKMTIPRRALYAPQPLVSLPEPSGRVAFHAPHPPLRVLQWLEEAFAMFKGRLDARGAVTASFVHLRDDSPFIVTAGVPHVFRRSFFRLCFSLRVCMPHLAAANALSTSHPALMSPDLRGPRDAGSTTGGSIETSCVQSLLLVAQASAYARQVSKPQRMPSRRLQLR